MASCRNPPTSVSVCTRNLLSPLSTSLLSPHPASFEGHIHVSYFKSRLCLLKNIYISPFNFRVMHWKIVLIQNLLFASYSLADISQCQTKNNCSWRPIVPVCGSDGKLYYNDCHLKYKKCMNPTLEIANYNHCKYETCPRPCTRELDEVCGSDGKLSSNPCTFLQHVCEVKPQIVYEIDLEVCINKKCSKYCAPFDKKCLRDVKNCRLLYGGGMGK